MPKYFGDDTTTKVTILDEDFPGTLKFEETAQTVPGGGAREFIYLKVQRVNGSDGKISCYVKTGPATDSTNGVIKNAVEYEEYLPVYEKVEFENGENEKTVKI